MVPQDGVPVYVPGGVHPGGQYQHVPQGGYQPQPGYVQAQQGQYIPQVLAWLLW